MLHLVATCCNMLQQSFNPCCKDSYHRKFPERNHFLTKLLGLSRQDDGHNAHSLDDGFTALETELEKLMEEGVDESLFWGASLFVVVNVFRILFETMLDYV